MNKKIEDSSSEPKKMDNILIGGFQDNHTFFMWQEVEEGEEPPICWEE